MDDDQFKAFLSLMMVSGPLSLNPIENVLLENFANTEARKRGFENWIEAFHKFLK